MNQHSSVLFSTLVLICIVVVFLFFFMLSVWDSNQSALCFPWNFLIEGTDSHEKQQWSKVNNTLKYLKACCSSVLLVLKWKKKAGSCYKRWPVWPVLIFKLVFSPTEPRLWATQLPAGQVWSKRGRSKKKPFSSEQQSSGTAFLLPLLSRL